MIRYLMMGWAGASCANLPRTLEASKRGINRALLYTSIGLSGIETSYRILAQKRRQDHNDFGSRRAWSNTTLPLMLNHRADGGLVSGVQSADTNGREGFNGLASQRSEVSDSQSTVVRTWLGPALLVSNCRAVRLMRPNLQGASYCKANEAA
ncbi:hypothetical protein KC349_g97 [Hortaea werneckii]|nr:hypothetical protein KC349_g97 [Hortaea werneckii]